MGDWAESPLASLADDRLAESVPIWNALGVTARDAGLAQGVQAEIDGYVSRLETWLGNEWFGRIMSSEGRTDLLDWYLPNLSGADTPMRTFRAFAASALAAQNDPGIDRALRQINGTSAYWIHLMDQLELGAVARAAGADVEFEPPDSAGTAGDLALAVPGVGTITVEITNRTASRSDRHLQRDLVDPLMRTVAGTPAGVPLVLEVWDYPAKYERVEILSAAGQRSTSGSGIPPTGLTSLAGSVRLRPDLNPEAVPGISVQIHGGGRDELGRLEERLVTKAQKARDGERKWVQLAAYNKLHYATDFASRSLLDQARALRKMIEPATAGTAVHGVIVAARTRLAYPDDVVEIDERTVAFRLRDDYVTHVVHLLATGRADPSEIDWWRSTLVAHVPTWLDQTAASLRAR